MRCIALTPLLILAACSEAGEPTKAEAPAATQLSAGQWEMTSEVTQVTQRDQGTPAIKVAEGDKTTSSVCIAEADAKQPQAALFAGEGSECTHRDMYMSNGRINATLACKRPGLEGQIATLVNGTYTADTIEGTAVTETSLVGEGDLKIQSKLSGRRTGECAAADAAS